MIAPILAMALSYATLDDVNFHENHAITPGHASDFTPHLAVGDCKTYAASKWDDLVRMGVDPSRLQILMVHAPNGEGHVILVVDNATVLDNLNRWPLPIKEAAAVYHFGVGR